MYAITSKIAIKHKQYIHKISVNQINSWLSGKQQPNENGRLFFNAHAVLGNSDINKPHPALCRQSLIKCDATKTSTPEVHNQ